MTVWSLQEKEHLSDESDIEDPSPEVLARYQAVRRHSVATHADVDSSLARRRVSGFQQTNQPAMALNNEVTCLPAALLEERNATDSLLGRMSDYYLGKPGRRILECRLI